MEKNTIKTVLGWIEKKKCKNNRTNKNWFGKTTTAVERSELMNYIDQPVSFRSIRHFEAQCLCIYAWLTLLLWCCCCLLSFRFCCCCFRWLCPLFSSLSSSFKNDKQVQSKNIYTNIYIEMNSLYTLLQTMPNTIYTHTQYTKRERFIIVIINKWLEKIELKSNETKST